MSVSTGYVDPSRTPHGHRSPRILTRGPALLSRPAKWIPARRLRGSILSDTSSRPTAVAKPAFAELTGSRFLSLDSSETSLVMGVSPLLPIGPTTAASAAGSCTPAEPSTLSCRICAAKTSPGVIERDNGVSIGQRWTNGRHITRRTRSCPRRRSPSPGNRTVPFEDGQRPALAADCDSSLPDRCSSWADY